LTLCPVIWKPRNNFKIKFRLSVPRPKAIPIRNMTQ
jgi:hypothetical protein